MAPVFYLLLALLCFQQLSECAAESASNGGMLREFQEINEYLLENSAQNDEPEANMLILNEWLKSNPIDVSDTLLVALRLLKSLMDIQSAHICNAHALEIKQSIIEAISGTGRGKIGSPVKRTRLYLIDMIIKHYFRQHAIACASVYPLAYLEKARQLDERTIELVDNLYASTVHMYAVFSNDIDELETSQGLSRHFLDDYRYFEARIAYNAILNMFENNIINSGIASKVEGKTIMHADKLRKTFQSIIVDPCQRYIALLGADVFDLAAFDRLFYKQVNDNELAFYKAWSKYQVCNLVVSKEEHWASALMSLTGRIVDNLK